MRFEFATAGQILFGPGVAAEIGKVAGSLGKHALVVSGLAKEYAQRMEGSLEERGVQCYWLETAGEPSIDFVQEGKELALESGCDLVIGFGGGSAIDSGKAISALMSNPGNVLDYLEVIGRGQTLENDPVPFVAIPTTAGTGAEVTRNAVLGSPEHGVKVSLRSPKMLPRYAIVDPELTYSLPPELTASTGLDALTQLIESFVSPAATPMTDGFCQEGIRRAGRSLLRAYQEGSNRAARLDMSLASLLGGLALANAKLGAVHGFAGVIGGMFPAPHGAICARLLPFVMEANVKALRERAPQNEALARYDQVARLLTSNDTVTFQEGMQFVFELVKSMDIPPLSMYGLSHWQFPELVEKSAKSSSMKGNPVILDSQEMAAILDRAL